MTLLKRLASDAFFRDNALFFVTTMVASALSYLFHPVLARLLSIEDYGEVQALISLYATLSILLGIFSTVSLNVFANVDEHDHHDRAARVRLISTLRVLAIGLTALMFLALLAASPWLGGFFHFRTPAPIAALALILAMLVGTLFRRTYLRGMRDFRLVGQAQMLETGGRLLFASALVLAGLRSIGAMFGIVLSQAAVYVFLRAKTARSLVFTKDILPLFGPEVRRELAFGLLILATSITTTSLYSADVLVVKHYFSPSEAGAYGGLSTVARIVMFVTGSVSGVLVPSIKLKNPPKENRKLLFKALILAGLLGGSVYLAFAVAPAAVIHLLLGDRYLAEVRLLPRLGFLMLLVAVIGPVMAYHLALRRRFIAPIGLVGVAFILALCAVDHATIAAVIGHFILGAALILAALAVWGAAPLLLNRTYGSA